MAKKRSGNILDASNEELKNIGKTIMKKAEEKKEAPAPKPQKKAKPKPQVKPKSQEKGRDKMLYVAPEIHKEARIQAARRDMKLKEYITFLILEDIKNM